MEPSVPKLSRRTADRGRRRSDQVDYLIDDNRLHRGKIICGTDYGIVVEEQTGNSAGETHLVPYGKAFFPESSVRPDLIEEMKNCQAKMAVEVLVRLHIDQPLEWHPAILSLFDLRRGTFGLVSISQHNSTVKAIVPANRIRTRTHEWTAVTQQHCRKLAPGLPEVLTCLSTSNVTNKRAWIEKGIYSSRNAHFLQETKSALRATEFPPFQSLKQWRAEMKERLSRMLVGSYTVNFLKPGHDASDANGILKLPAVVLAEIFECLDTPTCCRYRSVCSFSNGILTMPRIRNQLRLHYSGRVHSIAEGNEGRPEEEYLNAVCASLCWAPTIIISGMSDHDKPAVSLSTCNGRFFSRIMQEFAHHPARTVVLAHLHWKIEADDEMYPDTVLTQLKNEINAMASVCRTLLLHDVTGFSENSDARPASRFRVNMGRLVDGQQLTRQDWLDMMYQYSDGLPALTETEQTRLLEKLAEHLYEDNGREDWEDVQQALLEFRESVELCDWFRPSQTACQLSNPTAEALVKLELQKLPKIILLFCLEQMRNGDSIMEFVLSW